MKRLNIEGGTIELDVVLGPFSGQEPKTRELTVTKTELQVAKDVIERQQ